MEEVFIHHTAEVSPKACIGAGTKIWNGAQVREKSSIGKNCIISKDVYIDTGVEIGSNVKIQNRVNVYRGVRIEDDVFLGPSMTFTNDMYPRAFNTDWKLTETIVKKGASIGAGAVIVCVCTIGSFAMVGAGSVVTKDVSSYSLVTGNPARHIGWVCRCGQKLNGALICSACGTGYKLNDGELQPDD